MAHDLSSKTSVRRLNDGNEIPIFGLGVWRSEPGGETEQAVSWALKHGYRLIDTAAIYKNEEDVGNAIRKSGIPREEISVTTKLWDTDHGKANTLKAFEESLTKLGLDYIDLYLVHSPFGGKIVETWDAMVEIKEKGLARSIGVSSFNVHHLQQLKLARPDHIPAVNQIELHPYLARDECVAYCEQEGIVVEAYSPLTKGEKLKDPLLVQMAEKYKKSTAQLLIRWSLQRGNICIPKSAKEHRIIENGDVFDFNISDEDMQVLNLDLDAERRKLTRVRIQQYCRVEDDFWQQQREADQHGHNLVRACNSQLLVVATSDSAAALVSCRNTNSGPQTILAVVWGPDTTDQRMIPGGGKDKRLKISVYGLTTREVDSTPLMSKNGLDEQLITDWDPMSSPWES